MKKNKKVTKDIVRNIIREFIASSPLNTMNNENHNRAWDQVKIGFASGADQIWQQYKEYIGAFQWTPWKENLSLKQTSEIK